MSHEHLSPMSKTKKPKNAKPRIIASDRGVAEAEIGFNYFPALDGLRAISVFLVIFVHLKQRSGLLAHVPGWLGVDFFFVISGFLITTLLLREEREKGRIDVYAFYMRRFFRIVPIYGLILIVYVLLTYWSADKWGQMKSALPYYLTFLNEFAPKHVPFGTTWSLGIEEKFYLVWPVLFFVLLRTYKRALVLPILFLVTAFMPFQMGHSYFGLLAGCTLAAALANAGTGGLIQGVRRVPPVGLILLIGLGFYLVDLNQKSVFLFNGFVTLFLAHVLVAKNWLERLLSAPAFVWAGKRSYSMYLIHGLVLDAVQRYLYPTAAFRQITITILSFAVCALTADVLFRLVEAPARRYGKTILAKQRSRLPAPSATRHMKECGEKDILAHSDLTAQEEIFAPSVPEAGV
jgi:peptidoglycan/LPS O-acetylase OafA/YrhL